MNAAVSLFRRLCTDNEVVCSILGKGYLISFIDSETDHEVPLRQRLFTRTIQLEHMICGNISHPPFHFKNNDSVHSHSKISVEANCEFVYDNFTKKSYSACDLFQREFILFHWSTSLNVNFQFLNLYPELCNWSANVSHPDEATSSVQEGGFVFI